MLRSGQEVNHSRSEIPVFTIKTDRKNILTKRSTRFLTINREGKDVHLYGITAHPFLLSRI
jgi:hypothetical protein